MEEVCASSEITDYVLLSSRPTFSVQIASVLSEAVEAGSAILRNVTMQSGLDIDGGDGC